MPDVHEEKPDDRQSDDQAMPASRFRPKYRATILMEFSMEDLENSVYDIENGDVEHETDALRAKAAVLSCMEEIPLIGTIELERFEEVDDANGTL